MGTLDVIAASPSRGLWHDTGRRMLRNKAAMAGLAVILLLIVVAIAAPVLAPQGPRDGNLRLLVDGCCPGPSSAHLFGVDDQGRDVFTRVLYGARYTLATGTVSVAVGLGIGLLIGALAGFVGGFVDGLLMRIMDVMLAIPGLLLAIGIVAVLGRGLVQVMVAVGVVNIPIFARLMRGQVLGQREADFVLAARSVGVRRRTVLWSHVLPNAISPVIVAATLALATAIIDVAGLGFLGLGPEDPSIPEWGTMLTDANKYLQTAPHVALIPGAAIVVSVLAFNLIGDGLREALDPKLRGH